MKAIVGPGNEGNLVKGGRLFLSPILLIVEKRSVKKKSFFYSYSLHCGYDLNLNMSAREINVALYTYLKQPVDKQMRTRLYSLSICMLICINAILCYLIIF